jgi:hypothetical protein
MSTSQVAVETSDQSSADQIPPVIVDAAFLAHLAMELDDAAEGWEGGLADSVRAIVERIRATKVVPAAPSSEALEGSERLAVAELLRPCFEHWAEPQWFRAGADTTYYPSCAEYNDREFQAAWEGYQEGALNAVRSQLLPKLTQIASIVSQIGNLERPDARAIQLDDAIIQTLPVGAKLYIVEGM